ncbi:MAG: hypothetical protein ABFS32_20545 [Bacteroidota bacterium]
MNTWIQRSIVKYFSIHNVIFYGLCFMFIDILFFISYWLIGDGYVLFEPSVHSSISSLIGRVWGILHIPVDVVFGPLLFPNFESHS